MRKALLGIALVVVIVAATRAQANVTADIAGYVYFAHFPINGDDGAEIVRHATAELYKRTEGGGWLLFDSTTTSDMTGAYVFDDVDIGEGSSGLFQYADWFKLRVDASAEGCLPPAWPNARVADRYAYREPQPTEGEYEYPDAGKIRLDLVFYDDWTSPPAEPAEYALDFTGRFVCFDGQGRAYMPRLGYPSRPSPVNEATCPPGSEYLYMFGGCLGGHFYSEEEPPTWETAGYARFKFFEVAEGGPVERGAGYAYWDPDRPYWTIHVSVGEAPSVDILMSYVALPLP